MNTKHLSRILAVCLVLALLLGMVPASFAATRTYDGSEMIYVKVDGGDSWWTDANAWHALFFFGDSGSAWLRLEQTDGMIYGGAVPAGTWTHVIVCRMDPAKTALDWGSKWSQSGDIPMDSTKNYITSFHENSATAVWDFYAPGDDPGTEPPAPEYYLVGTMNGWQTQEAYKLQTGENSGEYVLAEVSLPANAKVKITDGTNWYPGGTNNDYQVGTAGTYHVSFYPDQTQLADYYEGYFKLTLLSAAQEPEPEPQQGDDKMILHCWNWSYATIQANLPAIKAAGYTAVQTSPAQPPKGYNANATVGDWWMLYQPLGFVISPADKTWLGGVDELASLCAAAHALDIQVIVDVVANHVGNGWDTLYAEALAQGMSEEEAAAYANQDNPNGGGKLFEITPPAEVGLYNPELYPAENPRTYFRDYIANTDSTTEGTVRGNIGMPDLRTETQTVQDSVSAYLIALIDAGVDGFRFDAAKHIETPSDGDYASDFWPNVLTAAQTHAETLNRELWVYGEILYQAAYTRKMSYYTPYMDVTDINYAGGLIYGFGQDQGASGIASLQFKDWNGPDQEAIAASDVVIFAETHDMYTDAHSSTSVFSVEDVNKSWAVAAARANVSALYFARPAGAEHNNPNDPTGWYPTGAMGAVNSYYWKNAEVAEANKFHTAFVGASEQVYAAGNYVVVERYDETRCGAVIVNALDTASALSFQAQHLADGTYYDQITGNEFTVTDGNLSGQMGSTGIVILLDTAPVPCEHQHTHTETVPPTCTEDGRVDEICDDCGRVIDTQPGDPALGHADANEDDYCDRCGLYLGAWKTVYFVDALDWINKNDYFTNIRFYAFGTGGQNTAWPGAEAEIVGRTTDDHGIWKAELNPTAWQYVKFTAPGENNTDLKTVNLAYLEAEGDPLVYVCADDTVLDDSNTAEYLCAIAPDLESICAHTAYTVTDNGDNTESKICTCCGHVISTEPTENPVTEPLEDSQLACYLGITADIELPIGISVLRNVLDGYDDWYVELTWTDDTGTEQSDVVAKGDPSINAGTYFYVVRSSKIPAKQCGDTFRVQTHAFRNGQEYVGPVKESSIKDLLVEQLKSTGVEDAPTYDPICARLCADILNYCASLQLDLDYKEDELCNEFPEDAKARTLLSTWATGAEPQVGNSTNTAEPNNRIFVNVSAQNRVVLGITVYGFSGNVEIHVTDGEGHDMGTVEAFQQGYGKVAYYRELPARGLRASYTYTVFEDGVDTGLYVEWSLERHVYGLISARDSGDPYVDLEQLQVFINLLKFIDSATAMFPNIG